MKTESGSTVPREDSTPSREPVIPLHGDVRASLVPRCDRWRNISRELKIDYVIGLSEQSLVKVHA